MLEGNFINCALDKQNQSLRSYVDAILLIGSYFFRQVITVNGLQMWST